MKVAAATILLFFAKTVVSVANAIDMQELVSSDDSVTEWQSSSPSAMFSSAPPSSIFVSSSIPTSSSMPSGSEGPVVGPSTDPPTGGGGKAEPTSSACQVNVKASSTLGVISAVVVAGVSFCV